jgi:circadian clock protein KaiB
MTSRKPTAKASPSRKSKPEAPASKAEDKRTTKPAAKRKESEVNGWTFHLYIAGRGERSERALRNLRKLCEANMKAGTYKIEVIDLAKKPALAKADQILAIPTLVRKLPEPMKRIIGDLSDADRALLSLDLPKQQ